VLQLVTDSLRYWVTSFHVDGFRFDLGVTLGRESNGFDPGSGFFDALRQDPILTRVKLISEPWDVGPGGYQLGHHPPGFAEWNDRFRDSTRRFWRGDAGERPEFAARLAGSGDVFDRHARGPWASVNYAASHDGFTLADVVSYAQRHNEPNGEDNKDGHGENYSANWGVEGLTTDQSILDIRARVHRAMLATVLFAHGTPMLLAGDEFGRSQAGNNNAYCQDNDVSWWDWSVANSEAGRDMRRFVARLITLRQQHKALHQRHFLHGHREPAPGIFDIAWFEAGGELIPEDSWRQPEIRLLALRRAARNDDGTVSLLTLLLNPTGEDHTFRLADPVLPAIVFIDTARPDAESLIVADNKIEVLSRSAVLVFARLERPAQ
jgi:glycogen operon protein